MSGERNEALSKIISIQTLSLDQCYFNIKYFYKKKITTEKTQSEKCLQCKHESLHPHPRHLQKKKKKKARYSTEVGGMQIWGDPWGWPNQGPLGSVTDCLYKLYRTAKKDNVNLRPTHTYAHVRAWQNICKEVGWRGTEKPIVLLIELGF